MRLLACITPPDNKLTNKVKGKISAIAKYMHAYVVVKVSILALLFIVTGCSQSDTVVDEPESLIAAADSAERAVWGEIVVVRGDSLRPSAFFDTTYKYLLPAILIEREKRIVTDSFARKTVLAVDRLQTSEQRQGGIATIQELERRDSLWSLRIDSLRKKYSTSISAYLDSAGVDSSTQKELISQLAVRERFIPKWRDRLDSLMRETLRTQREIIHFIDTASERIKIVGALQFTEATDMMTYQSFTAKLEQLALAQSDALQASYSTDRSSPKTRDGGSDTTMQEGIQPDTLSRPSVHSWPQAVRIR